MNFLKEDCGTKWSKRWGLRGGYRITFGMVFNLKTQNVVSWVYPKVNANVYSSVAYRILENQPKGNTCKIFNRSPDTKNSISKQLSLIFNSKFKFFNNRQHFSWIPDIYIIQFVQQLNKKKNMSHRKFIPFREHLWSLDIAWHYLSNLSFFKHTNFLLACHSS